MKFCFEIKAFKILFVLYSRHKAALLFCIGFILKIAGTFTDKLKRRKRNVGGFCVILLL